MYDANGSLTARTNITSTGTATALYDYDLKNKLSAVTTGGSTTKYEYNHQGIRVRTVTAGSTKYYLVDGNNHTGYAQVLEEMDTLGTPTMSYVLGDDVLAQCGTNKDDPAYLLYDGHGSTRQLVHSTVNVTEQYNYDAYGVSLTTLSNPETTMLYSGEQYDSTLGMYNNRARFYDPSNGRFNAMDSFEGYNEDPQSLHKYLYAHCDPVDGTDPSGNFTFTELMLAVGILFVIQSAITFAINPSGKNGVMLGVNVAMLPFVWVRGLNALGKSPQIAKGFLSALNFLIGTERLTKIYLEGRAGIVLLGKGEKVVEQLLGVGKKAVDLIAYNKNTGGFILAEAKTTLQAKHIVDMEQKALATIEAIQKVASAGSEGKIVVEELIITYQSIKASGLGPYTIDAAGYVLKNGQQVLIDGIKLVAKLL